jgi:hypothetical protein
MAIGRSVNDATVSREVGLYLKACRNHGAIQKRTERLIRQVNAVASSLMSRKVRPAALPISADLDADLNNWQASMLALRNAWNATPDAGEGS